ISVESNPASAQLFTLLVTYDRLAGCWPTSTAARWGGRCPAARSLSVSARSSCLIVVESWLPSNRIIRMYRLLSISETDSCDAAIGSGSTHNGFSKQMEAEDTHRAADDQA